MPIVLIETVLTYQKQELDSWIGGDKSLVPEGVPIPDIVLNQQNYHFGEYFVLAHYFKHGWKGFIDYGIGEWEPNNPRYKKGRAKVVKIFGDALLSEIRSHLPKSGKGEPDVFLYKDTGETLFLEVKKQKDRVSVAQLQNLALIKGILGANVGIVYLVEQGKDYRPKHYELDLDTAILSPPE